MSELADNSHDTIPDEQAPVDENDGGYSLLDLAIVLAKYKKLVIGVPFAVSLLTVVYSLLLPNVYTGTAKILPPQQSQSSTAAFLGQLGALAGVPMGALPVKSSAELYVGMLKSRTVADAIIERFDLNKLYAQEYQTITRTLLASQSLIEAGLDGIITIGVDSDDPKLAAAMANAYVDELGKLTQTLAITESSQRRLFFENQLKGAKENLANAEIALKQTQQRTGLIRLDEQGRVIIENVARLRAQIAIKEVQMSAMRSFATTENADYLVAQRELAALRSQLARVEKDQNVDEGSVFLPTGKIAEAGLEYVRRFRDVKYHETIFELLAKQYELAKLDEAKEGSIVQVIDRAVVPDRKSKPKRAIIVLSATFVAAFAVLLWIFMREIFARWREDPQQWRRVELLREYLRFR